MRTTVNIDDELLAKARDYTGEKEKTKLLHLGLEALIQREIANRLAALGGTMPDLKVPRGGDRPETEHDSRRYLALGRFVSKRGANIFRRIG